MQFTRDLFDEEFYLGTYPDVAAALRAGTLPDAWEHFARYGRDEGRQSFRFDEDFYGSSYPLARSEVAAGLAANLVEHYANFGRHRGYLPYFAAKRPFNAAATRFAGLWSDAANSADLIAGKLEVGTITERQAELLTTWTQKGFVVLESAIPDSEIDAALADLDRAFAGRLPDVYFECPAIVRGIAGWHEGMNAAPAKVLDLHWFSNAIRDVIFSPQIMAFLHLVFDSKALASQTLGFYRGSAQDPHQDSAYVPYTLAQAFVASWIALEDVAAGAGELFYFEGSHRLEDFLYGDEYKSVVEAIRAGVPRDALDIDIDRHMAGIRRRCELAGFTEKRFRPKRGDVLIWHSDLVHGGSSISEAHTRRSIVTHYCPRRAVPLYMENRKLEIREHAGTAYYSSSHY